MIDIGEINVRVDGCDYDYRDKDKPVPISRKILKQESKDLSKKNDMYAL